MATLSRVAVGEARHVVEGDARVREALVRKKALAVTLYSLASDEIMTNIGRDVLLTSTTLESTQSPP